MKKLKTLVISSCFLLSACSLPPTYLGDKLTPTTHVDVYYSASEVKRSYKIIGQLDSRKYIKEAIEKNMVTFAKREGGDGVIIFPEMDGHIKADVLKYK